MITSNKETRKVGRPRRVLSQEFKKHYPQWKYGTGGKITAVQFSRLLGVHRTTIYRMADQYEEEQQETASGAI